MLIKQEDMFKIGPLITNMVNAISSIVKAVLNIIKMIQRIVTSKSETRRNNDQNLTKQDMDGSQHSINYNKLGLNEEVQLQGMSFNERLEAFKTDSVVYEIKQNNIHLVIPDTSQEISVIKEITLESCPEITYVSCGTVTAAISNIKFWRVDLNITCSHVVALIDSDELEGYSNVNKMLCMKGGRIDSNPIKFKAIKADDVIWYTRDTATAKDTFIKTEVSSTINANVLYKGRMQIMTVAIVVALRPDKVYIVSGTLMIVRDRPYIATYTKTNKEGIVYIVAVALLHHDYQLTIK